MKSVSRSLFWEGGFGPCSLYFIIHSVPIKNYLGNPYTVRKISLSSFRVFSSFLLWVSFLRRYFISQKRLNSVGRGAEGARLKHVSDHRRYLLTKKKRVPIHFPPFFPSNPVSSSPRASECTFYQPNQNSVGIFWRSASKILLAQVVCWCNFYLKNCASKI
jgi:hypothetical protein